MKRIYNGLKILLGCLIVMLAGYSAYQYYDYRMNPGYYAITSFPWYASIVLLIMFMLPVTAVILLILFLLRRRFQGRSQGLNG